MNEGFEGGVKIGGLKKSYEVSILVCFLIENSKKGLSKKDICDICLEEEFANYFEINNSLSELLDQGQIESENEIFILSKEAEGHLGVLMRDLPLSIREHGARAVLRFEARKKSLEENKASISEVLDGFILSLSILDLGTDLLELKLFLPSLESAKQMQANFLNAPSKLYRGLVALLSGDEGEFINISKEKAETLFTSDEI